MNSFEFQDVKGNPGRTWIEMHLCLYFSKVRMYMYTKLPVYSYGFLMPYQVLAISMIPHNAHPENICYLRCVTARCRLTHSTTTMARTGRLTEPKFSLKCLDIEGNALWS